MNEFSQFLVPGLIVAYFIWRFVSLRRVRGVLPKLLAEGAVVVDVRSPAEFRQGSRPGSINIPLTDLPARSKELDREKTIVLCCASGARSGMAVGILKANGFERVVNAGPWTNTLL